MTSIASANQSPAITIRLPPLASVQSSMATDASDEDAEWDDKLGRWIAGSKRVARALNSKDKSKVRDSSNVYLFDSDVKCGKEE